MGNGNTSAKLLGSLAATMLFVGLGAVANAQNFTAYNDLAWGTGQLNTNITRFTAPNGGSGLPTGGQLVNFANGNATGITLTVSGGTFNGTSQATQGVTPPIGTDAFNIFNGFVSVVGVMNGLDAPSPGGDVVLIFNGLDPVKFYDFVYYAHRNDHSYARASLVTISGHEQFTNNSSIANDNPNEVGGVLFTGPTDTSTRLPADNDNGYVARFSNVTSGSDGIVILTVSFDGDVASQFQGKYGSAVRLVESNSPVSLGESHDLNGDGKGDLVWRNTSTGAVDLWLMNGATILSSVLPGGLPTNVVLEQLNDVNGDKKADIIWRNSSTGAVTIWLMDGTTISSTGSPGGAPTEWVLRGAGDVNGDGKADLVWQNSSTGVVAIWLLDGTTIASTGFPGGVPTEWQIVKVVDVDGDIKADIIWRNSNTGVVAIWLMNGTTIASAGFPGGAPINWIISDAGDLNGDGKRDLVWRDISTGATAVWLLNGTTIASTGFPGGVPNDWVIEQVNDINGDTRADVIWRNTFFGACAVWFMNGSTINSVGFPGGASPPWEIQG